MLPQILYLYIFRVLIHKNSSNETRALPIPLFFSSSDRMSSKTVFWPTVHSGPNGGHWANSELLQNT